MKINKAFSQYRNSLDNLFDKPIKISHAEVAYYITQAVIENKNNKEKTDKKCKQLRNIYFSQGK